MPRLKISLCTFLILALSLKSDLVGNAAQAATSANLNPQIEGIYVIQVQCPKNSPGCTSYPFNSIDRVSIIGTPSRMGHSNDPLADVTVTFASSLDGSFVSPLDDVTVGPDANHMSGTPSTASTTNRIAYFDLAVNPVTGDISGEVQDAQYPGIYPFTGRPLARVGDLDQSPPPVQLSSDLISGQYHGFIGATPGHFLLQTRPDKKVIGFFTSDLQVDGGPVLAFNFQTATWNPTAGLLRLVFVNAHFDTEGEVVVAMKSVKDGHPVFSGYEFSGFAENPTAFSID